MVKKQGTRYLSHSRLRQRLVPYPGHVTRVTSAWDFLRMNRMPSRNRLWIQADRVFGPYGFEAILRAVSPVGAMLSAKGSLYEFEAIGRACN